MEDKNVEVQKSEGLSTFKEVDEIMKLTENLMRVGQDTLKNEDEKKNSLNVPAEDATSSLKPDYSFDTIIQIAKTLVNPELLSLLSKFGTKNEVVSENSHLILLKQSIEQLTSEVRSLKDEIAFTKERFHENSKKEE